MVLVDTSVWVSHLRRGDERLAALLIKAEVMSHDFIVGELACGRLKNRDEVLSLLQALPRTPVAGQSEILYFIKRHSLNGMGIGFVDVHLLASARLAGVRLWTLDKKLQHAAARLGLSIHAR